MTSEEGRHPLRPPPDVLSSSAAPLHSPRGPLLAAGDGSVPQAQSDAEDCAAGDDEEADMRTQRFFNKIRDDTRGERESKGPKKKGRSEFESPHLNLFTGIPN